MQTFRDIISKLPLPKNTILRIFVALFYFSLAIYILPLLIGGFIAYLIYKNGQGKALKYGLSALVVILSLAGGSSWIAGLSASSTSPSTQASVVEVKSDIPTTAPTETATETPATTPEATATTSPTTIPTAAKISTPSPTKKIIYPTSTPKPFIPTSTPKPIIKSSTPVPFYGGSGGDMDCPDFPNHEAAQAYFISKGGSPTNNVDRLDRDGDGLACED
jgi:hypothetical protein